MSTEPKTLTLPNYMENAQGHLVPLKNVKDIDIERDAVVNEIAQRAEKLDRAICEFKDFALGEVEAFADLSAERWGVHLGGNKGNITLPSYNGMYRVKIDRQDRQEFNESLNVARQLIKECILEWTEGTRDEVRLIIDQAFETNKQGQVSVSKVQGLKSLKIDHPKWLKAMDAIDESIRVTTTKTYIRVYKRNVTGDYIYMPMDGSSALPVVEHSNTDTPVCDPTEADEVMV